MPFEIMLFNKKSARKRIDQDRLDLILVDSGLIPKTSHFGEEGYYYRKEGADFFIYLKNEVVEYPLGAKSSRRDCIYVRIDSGGWDVTLEPVLKVAFMLMDIFDLVIFDPQSDKYITSENPWTLKKSYRDWLGLLDELTDELESGNIAPPPSLLKKDVSIRSDAKRRKKDSGSYLSDYVIEITGEIRNQTENVVLVDNAEVLLSDAPFQLFLRLVLKLKKDKIGYFYYGNLITKTKPGRNPEDFWYQRISRMKRPFKTTLAMAIDDFEIDDFFEKRPKQIRLSNDPTKIEVDREMLLKHPNSAIVKLTEQFKDRLPR